MKEETSLLTLKKYKNLKKMIELYSNKLYSLDALDRFLKRHKLWQIEVERHNLKRFVRSEDWIRNQNLSQWESWAWCLLNSTIHLRKINS